MEFKWKPQGNDQSEWGMTCSSAICGHIDELLTKHVPELAADSPLARIPEVKVYFADDLAIIKIAFSRRGGIPVIGIMETSELADAEAVFRSGKANVDFYRTKSVWVGTGLFTYIGPRHGGALCWPDVCDAILTWINGIVLPEILEINRKRVQHAIPSAPVYNFGELYRALWVLECEEDMEQGTAFALEGIGLVTCDHCLGKATNAFKWSELNKTYPVKIAKSNSRVDLALLEGVPLDFALPVGHPSEVKQMDHLLVLGHPNHRKGDTPICSPGLVVGFRQFSGVRRILTNAAIVAGASGGPVVDSAGSVVGVAVCGSRTFGKAGETEDHAIIPIDALDLL